MTMPLEPLDRTPLVLYGLLFKRDGADRTTAVGS